MRLGVVAPVAAIPPRTGEGGEQVEDWWRSTRPARRGRMDAMGEVFKVKGGEIYLSAG